MPKKKKKSSLLVILIALVAMLILTDISTYIIYYYKISPKAHITQALVTQIISGDSFAIDSGETVKLAGIKAPSPGEPYFLESAKMLEFLLLNKTVSLESEPSSTSKYAYADYNSEKIFVNAESLRQGYSLPDSIDSLSHKKELEQARQDCLSSKLGLCG